MKKLLLLTLSIVFLVSCQDNDLILPTDTIGCAEENSACIYSIPVDSAMAALNDYLKSEEPQSRGTIQRRVANIKAIPYPKTRSRAVGDSITCENILYVANFENNQGYAILSADSRINGSVLAVTEQGNFIEDLHTTPIFPIDSESIRPTYKGYATTGPGWYTTPESEGVLFMNPNTVNLYDSDVDDTLVGNFDGEITGWHNLQGEPVNVLEQPSISKNIAIDLCRDYALSEINNNPNKPLIPQDSIIGIEPYIHVTFKYSSTDWRITESVAPILWMYAKWHQKYPYNIFCPYKGIPPFTSQTEHSPAGCFPVALAKIMAYYSMPYVAVYNNSPINWEDIYSHSQNYDVEVAKLMASAGVACGSLYLPGGTFSFPSKVRRAMQSFGFTNVKDYTYNYDRLLMMLKARKPFIMYAMPGIQIHKSHSWIIDGYKIKQRTTTTYIYHNNVLNNTQTDIQTIKMVHCDFGQESSASNGYYIDGIFDTKDPNREPDNAVDMASYPNYNKYRHIIMYDVTQD